MGDVEHRRKKKKKRARAKAVYVEPVFPVKLTIASFLWVLLGWLIASQVPNLAFLPGLETVNIVCPLITVAFIAINFYGAMRNLWNGVHPFGYWQ